MLTISAILQGHRHDESKLGPHADSHGFKARFRAARSSRTPLACRSVLGGGSRQCRYNIKTRQVVKRKLVLAPREGLLLPRPTNGIKQGSGCEASSSHTEELHELINEQTVAKY